MCQHIVLLLPNQPGEFLRATRILSEQLPAINVLGYALSSEGRPGLLYLLCSEHGRAFKALSDKYKFYCSEREVQIVQAEHTPGKLAAILEVLAGADPPLNLPNSYQAVSSSGQPLVVMEFDNKTESHRAKQVLRGKNFILLSAPPE